jgi:hypothetical protein
VKIRSTRIGGAAATVTMAASGLLATTLVAGPADASLDPAALASRPPIPAKSLSHPSRSTCPACPACPTCLPCLTYT